MQIEESAGTPNKFIVLRQEVLLDKNLNAVDKIVCARICSFDEYFESSEACAKVLGLSQVQVERAKRKLEKAGYIKCIANTGRGKRYRAKYDMTKLSYQTLQNCHIRPDKNVRSDLTKLSDIDKRLEENLYISNVATAKAESTLPSEAYEIAELLLKLMLERKPNRKVQKGWRERWAKDIDLAHRIDKRDWKSLKEVAIWSQQDSFWQQNILSGYKLREKFDLLEDKMNNTSNQTIIL